MKKLIGLALSFSALTVGCRSAPIAVPELPADQLIVNQPHFEKAVQARIIGHCAMLKEPAAPREVGPISRNVLCRTAQVESGIR